MITERGAEPRQIVKYELAPGEQHFSMQTKIRAGTAYASKVVAHGGGAVELPTAKVDATIVVTAVGPDGTATVTTAIDDATLLDDASDPTLRARFASALATTHGVRGTWHLRADGRTSDLRFDAENPSPGTKEQLDRLATSLTQLAVVLPDQPVGIGATWKVTSSYSTGLIAWANTVTYRIVALTESTASIHADIAAHAAHQTLMSQPNASSELVSGELSANADIVVDRHHAIATGSTHATSELNLDVHRHGIHEVSTTRTETSCTITAR